MLKTKGSEESERKRAGCFSSDFWDVVQDITESDSSRLESLEVKVLPLPS